MSLCRELLKINSLVNYTSKCGMKTGLKSWPGIKYFGFKYYPRDPSKVDPPYQPTKLLMVQRIKNFKGLPYWQKRVLADFNIDGKNGEIAIVKNIPEVNAKLYKVKHAVKILPITTPNGLPKDGDLSSGHLNDETGEFTVSEKLRPDEERLSLTENFLTEPSRLDSTTIKKHLRDKWNNPW